MERDSDLGGRILIGVRQRLEAAGRETQAWGPRGIEVLLDGRRQRVWAAAGGPDADGSPWRIHVRMAFVGGFYGSTAQRGALGAARPTSAMSGIVRSLEDRMRLELATSLHVHQGNGEWAADFLARVARLQWAEAARLASSAELLSAGVKPDRHGCAAAGPATVATGMLSDALGFGTVAGEDVEGAIDGELKRCVDALGALPFARAAAAAGGLVAGFAAEEPWLAGGPSLLEVERSAESPDLGKGLRLELTMPRTAEPEDALVLNEREAAPGSVTDMVGGWSVEGGVLHHTAFVPHALYAPGLALHLVLTAARRARWARGWPPRAAP